MVLERALIAVEEGSAIAKAVGSKGKEWVSVAFYALGLVAAFAITPYLSVACYVAVAIMWLVPDRRFERKHAE